MGRIEIFAIAEYVDDGDPPRRRVHKFLALSVNQGTAKTVSFESKPKSVC